MTQTGSFILPGAAAFCGLVCFAVEQETVSLNAGLGSRRHWCCLCTRLQERAASWKKKALNLVVNLRFDTRCSELRSHKSGVMMILRWNFSARKQFVLSDQMKGSPVFSCISPSHSLKQIEVIWALGKATSSNWVFQSWTIRRSSSLWFDDIPQEHFDPSSCPKLKRQMGPLVDCLWVLFVPFCT